MTHTFTPPTASEGIETFLEQHKSDIRPKGRAYIRECAAKMIQFCALPEYRAKHVPPEQQYRSREAKRDIAAVPMPHETRRALGYAIDRAAYAAQGVKPVTDLAHQNSGGKSSVILPYRLNQH